MRNKRDLYETSYKILSRDSNQVLQTNRIKTPSIIMAIPHALRLVDLDCAFVVVSHSSDVFRYGHVMRLLNNGYRLN